MKQITTYIIISLLSLGAYAQPNSKNKGILEISYTNRNNIEAGALDKNFEAASDLSEENIRDVKSVFMNAYNKYLLYIDPKTFNSVYEKDPSFVPEENYIDEVVKDFTLFNSPFLAKEKNALTGTLEMGNTERVFIKGAPTLKWKITGETKKIGKWQCTKAIPQGDLMPSSAEVWFTEDVPFPNGPLHYCGLPGLVVEVVVPNLTRITFAGMKTSDLTEKAFAEKVSAYKKKTAKEKPMTFEAIKKEFPPMFQ